MAWTPPKRKKKPIDIDIEANGKSVGPPIEKARKLDLTAEIRQFLDNEISTEAIKKVLCRFHGPITDYMLSQSKIKIIQVSKHGYFIVISDKRNYEREYYVNAMNFVTLGFWKEKDICTSMLKQEFRHKIYEWLKENIE